MSLGLVRRTEAGSPVNASLHATYQGHGVCPLDSLVGQSFIERSFKNFEKLGQEDLLRKITRLKKEGSIPSWGSTGTWLLLGGRIGFSFNGRLTTLMGKLLLRSSWAIQFKCNGLSKRKKRLQSWRGMESGRSWGGDDNSNTLYEILDLINKIFVKKVQAMFLHRQLCGNVV